MNEINPGDGYRILGPDEEIIDGDEGIFPSALFGGKWVSLKVYLNLSDKLYVKRLRITCRRKIEMSNPSQKYDPLLNKWARCLRSGSIVQLRQITNRGRRIIEFYDGTVSIIQDDQLEVLEKCTGYNWKEEKTLVIGCKTLSKNGNSVMCNGLVICNLSYLSNTITCIKSAAKQLNSVCESMLFTDNRGQHHSVKFSDIENFLAD